MYLKLFPNVCYVRFNWGIKPCRSIYNYNTSALLNGTWNSYVRQYLQWGDVLELIFNVLLSHGTFCLIHQFIALTIHTHVATIIMLNVC